MATGFRTKSGQVITGKFGEALAKANPSRGMTVSDKPGDVIRRVSSGGGGGSSGRGGGGGGSSGGGGASQMSIDLVKKEKAERELRQRQEQQRRQQQQQQQREQRIQSGKITGQLGAGGGTPLQMTAYDPETRFKKRYTRSIFDAGVSAVKNLAFNVKEGLIGDREYRPVLGEFTTTDPFKFETTAFSVPQFGTVQTSSETGKAGAGFRDVTFEELQRDVEFKRDIEIRKSQIQFEKELDKDVGRLQKKVDIGEITVEEAREELLGKTKEINKEFKEKQKKAFEKNPDIQGVFTRTGTRRQLAELAPEIGITAAAVGASIIGTPAAGAAIATAGFTARGVGLLAEKPKKEEAFRDIFEAQGEIIKGSSISEIQDSNLLREFKGKRKQASFALLSGASSGIGLAGATRSSIFTGRIENLQGKEFVLAGKEIGKGKGGALLVKSKLLRQTKYLRETVNVESPLFNLGTSADDITQFSSLGGKGKRTLTVIKSGLGLPDEGIYSSSKFSIVGKGKASQALLGEVPIDDLIAARGRGDIILEGTRRPFEFGGLAKDEGKFTRIISGRMTSKIIRPVGKVTGIDVSSGTEINKFILRQSGKTKVTARGAVIKFGQGADDIVVSLPKKTDITTVSFSPTGSSSLQQKSVLNLKKSFNLDRAVKGTQILQSSAAAEVPQVIVPSTKTSSLFIPSLQQKEKESFQEVKTLRKTRSIQKGLSGSSTIKVLPQQKQKSILGQSSMSIQAGSVIQKSINLSRLKRKQVQRPIQRIQQFQTPFGKFTPRTGIDFNYGFNLPAFNIPAPKLGGFKRRKSQRAKQPTQFQTSLTGSIFRIKSKPIKLKGLGYSPFQIRGIVNGKNVVVQRFNPVGF